MLRPRPFFGGLPLGGGLQFQLGWQSPLQRGQGGIHLLDGAVCEVEECPPEGRIGQSLSSCVLHQEVPRDPGHATITLSLHRIGGHRPDFQHGPVRAGLRGAQARQRRVAGARHITRQRKGRIFAGPSKGGDRQAVLRGGESDAIAAYGDQCHVHVDRRSHGLELLSGQSQEADSALERAQPVGVDVISVSQHLEEIEDLRTARTKVVEMKLLVALRNSTHLDGDHVEEELEDGPEEEPAPDCPLQAADIEGHLWPQAERVGDTLNLACGLGLATQRLEDPRPHGGGLHHGA